MTAALLAAIAVWCAWPASVRPRARRVLTTPETHHRPDPAMIVAVCMPVVGVVLLGPLWGVVIGGAVAPLAHRTVARLESGPERRRLERVRADLPAALDLVVAMLLVGRPTETAFALAAEATAGPLGVELSTIAGRLAVSADLDGVWGRMSDDPALAPVGRAFRRAASSGMPVAEIAVGVADELRRERVARLRERGQRVGVRTAGPLGLCFLPAFFLIGIVPTIAASFATFTW